MLNALLLPTVVTCFLAVTPGRTWTDSTGQYKTQAELIARNEELVVLKKENHDLIAVPIDKLSKEDREYLASKETQDQVRRAADQMQTWTMRSGLQVRGRVVDFGRKDVTIQRRRGKTYINDKVFGNLPEVYRRMLPIIVSHFEKIQLKDAAMFEDWALRQGGVPKTYTLEGVLLELDNGDEYGVPFFLFSDKDLKVLQPGWEQWLAAAKTPEPTDDQQHAFLLQSAAQAYQRNELANRRIAMTQLQLQAVQAGVTSLWEVRLTPGRGVAGFPLNVVVPGRNSRDATVEALRLNPGYLAGPVAKVSGY